MKLLLLSLALASIALAAPGIKHGEVSSSLVGRETRETEGGEEECEGAHCFHGQHVWNLGDFHQERKRREAEDPRQERSRRQADSDMMDMSRDREEEDSRQERSRRQAEDRPWIPEDQKCEDGTPHCFHGWHIFNLQPYHTEKRSV